MAVHIENKNDLDSKLKEAGDNLVVIDFSATWCGPCRNIKPVFKFEAIQAPREIEEGTQKPTSETVFLQLATEHLNVVFLEVDVDECDDIASDYGIVSMPTFVFLKRGEKVSTFSGANPDQLKQAIMEHK